MRKVKNLAPVDQLWLAEYEEKKKAREGASKNYGRSASQRTVKFEMQEAAAAEGEGNAAVAAASAALVAKEEGRRLDYLATTGHESMKQACEEWRSMCKELRVRQRNFDEVHIQLLTAWRDHFIARTHAETALVQQQESGDPANQMLLMVIAKHLGIDLGGLPPQQPQQRPPRPPPFGPQQQRPPQRRPPPNGA